MLAYRLARLPVPSIPTGPDDLKTDTESVDGPSVLRNSERADAFLTGLLWTVSLLVLGGEVVLAEDGRLPAVLLCLVLALLSLLRARPFLSRAQRTPVLLAGTVGLAGRRRHLRRRLTGGTARPDPRRPGRGGRDQPGLRPDRGRQADLPVWGRTLDIVEILLIIALVPLAVWVCGAYGWIVNLRP
ncbi:hypothetical protein V2I01_17175 [Micromonospora sp. BRA006-A]|nr:hypothetical protein [Micromonospora sp. BRA006-A]